MAPKKVRSFDGSADLLHVLHVVISPHTQESASKLTRAKVMRGQVMPLISDQSIFETSVKKYSVEGDIFLSVPPFPHLLFFASSSYVTWA